MRDENAITELVTARGHRRNASPRDRPDGRARAAQVPGGTAGPGQRPPAAVPPPIRRTADREGREAGRGTRPAGRDDDRPAAAAAVDAGAMEEALEVLAGKWVPAVICELQCGSRRHADLARAIGLDSKQLARALHRLHDAGLVAREVEGDRAPPRVQYRLTLKGREVLGPLRAIVQCLRSRAATAGRATAHRSPAEPDRKE
ncbi:hypothetical protein Sru01_47190 [Sphaerisporangium rufum]|uniref:HTH hxlR-type domain-containing protein n=1 Tax=Sphaerisporangium rufum TaxID=1381558 RepID=A0A919V2I5_9ACTN|nr:helix-turn-helix domain-containing protein [Sphaerisporangium rufum]GII79737.1 hypothetical protein Sru01_47190 [Sphaerisporangium rufum]